MTSAQKGRKSISWRQDRTVYQKDLGEMTIDLA
jgi:hypothetical protein